MEGILANELLNSLPMQIAVLDEHGTILAVNEEWRRFARENGGDGVSGYVGRSYLSVCEEAIRNEGDATALAMRDGMLELLRGERGGFSVEYPCHSPEGPRWFDVHISRFTHKGATYLATVHEDITARKLAEIAHYETEMTLREVLEALPVGVWVMNREGRIVMSNPAGQHIWGGERYAGPEDFAKYKGWRLDDGRPVTAEKWAAARAIQKGETSIDEEIRIECFDGASKIILSSAIPLRDNMGKLNGAIVVNQDITPRKQVEEKLHEALAALNKANRELQRVLAREQHRARTDHLTGLNNRRHFFEMSEQLFTVAQRYQTPLSVMMFDIDHFKEINDQYGHQAGDEILKCIARIADEHVREADVLARYGGEEFIVMLPNTDANEALAAAENIRERVAACRETDLCKLARITISAGIADMLPEDDSLNRLIQRADQALYAAKHSGRNCSRVFPAHR